MKRRFFVLVAIWVFYILLATKVFSAVVKVSDPGDDQNIQPAIKTAIDQANSGDIVLLPKGKFYFDYTIKITKAVSIVGQGNTADGTLLYRREDVSDNDLASSSWKWFFQYNGETFSNDSVIIEGIYFKGKIPSEASGDGKSLAADGALWIEKMENFVVANCRFENFGYGAIVVTHYDNNAKGLITNNKFIHNYKYSVNLGYGVVVMGTNDQWVSDPQFGTNNFIFIEDNYFEKHRHSVAGGGAGKYVCRHNIIYNNLWGHAIDMHESRGSGSNLYSTRAIECYDNKITNDLDRNGKPITSSTNTNDLTIAGADIRGGEALIHDNDIEGFIVGIGATCEPHDYPQVYPIPYQIGYASGLAYGDSHSGTANSYGDGDLFEWNNTFDRYPGTPDPSHMTWIEGSSTTWIKMGRDYQTTAKPGYTPYVYPHPLKVQISRMQNKISAMLNYANDQSFEVTSDNLNSTMGQIKLKSGENINDLNFSLSSDNTSDIVNNFSIDTQTGFITLNDLHYFSVTSKAIILVDIFDKDYTGCAEKISVTINYLNKQVRANYPPVIEDQDFSIDPLGQGSVYIGKVAATDPDGDPVRLLIVGGNENNLFLLDSMSGALYLESSLLGSTVQSTDYNLIVSASDSTHTSMATIVVAIIKPDNKIYIDPDNTSGIQNGTMEHPYSGWDQIVWTSNTSYLQKSGTHTVVSDLLVQADSITISSYGTGDKPIIQSSNQSFIIKLYNKTNVSVENLHFIGDSSIACIYFAGDQCTDNVVKNCLFDGSVYGLRIVEGKDYHITNNRFRNNTSGIYSLAENIEVHYNVFQTNSTAIEINSYNSDAHVYNNVFYNNEQGISSSYSEVVLYNNIFYLDHTGQRALNSNLDKLISGKNIFYPEQDGFIEIGDISYNSINDVQKNQNIDLNSYSVDPQFTDASLGDFQLEPTSPAIDAGIFIGLASDFDGKLVPEGYAPDIGSFESDGYAINTSGITVTAGGHNDLNIYPNPSNGSFDLKNSSNNKIDEIEIYNLNGTSVLQDKNSGIEPDDSKHFSVTDLVPGVYFLKAIVGNRINLMKLIIR